MELEEIDSSNGVLLPFYDPDTNMVYLCGKVCVAGKSVAFPVMFGPLVLIVISFIGGQHHQVL